MELLRKYVLLVILFTVSVASVVLGQTPTGTIEGDVTDPGGAAIAAATVTIFLRAAWPRPLPRSRRLR